MKEVLKRSVFSFFISSFAGVTVNLIIDCILNASGEAGFISMSPDYVRLFPTPVIAAYVNVLLYGLIGFTFSVMTFIFSVERIGLLLQNIIYFVVTSAVCVSITMILWQLQKYPAAFICTLAGYAATHVIMFIIEYRNLKNDINEINMISENIE